MISVKETPFTSAFEDDADRVECTLNTSVLIPAIARTCPNHLETIDGVTSLCGLIWMTRNWLSPIAQHYAFQDRNQLPCIHRACCHLGNCETSDWGVASSPFRQIFAKWGIAYVQTDCFAKWSTLKFVISDTLEEDNNDINIEIFLCK